MKVIIKFLFIFAILFFYNEKLFSFLFCDYGGDHLTPWKIEAYYKEKYFEYNFYYKYDDLFVDTINGDEANMLSGMKQNFGLRLGLPGNYILNTDILYIFQKIENENYNNLQAITVLLEKNKKDFFDIIFGLKIPIWEKETNNIRILTEKGKLNLILGIFNNINYFFFKNKFFILFETPFDSALNYKNDLFLGEMLGFNIYDDREKQSIDILLELSINLINYNNTYSMIGVIIPQLKIRFYNDFEFKIGMQILGHAENYFYHKDDKFLYIIKLNYIINSDNRKTDETSETTLFTTTPTITAPITMTPTTIPADTMHNEQDY